MEKTDLTALLRVTQSLYPVCDMDEADRHTLARYGEFSILQPQEHVVALDDKNWLTYLLKGELVLFTDEGRAEHIQSNSPRARLPLFRIHPPGMRALANNICLLVRFDRRSYDDLSARQRSRLASANETVVLDGAMVEREMPLFERIYKAFEQGEIPLPSLPDVALKIRTAVDDPNIGAKDVAKIVLADPALSARLINVANSAAYRREVAVTSVYQAVTRLGLATAQNIAVSLALKNLFQAGSPLLQQRMQQLYEHSARIASLAYVLAKKSGRLNPERALLAGLLHDIGVIPILNYAGRDQTLSDEAEMLEQVIGRLRHISSHLVLNRLGFEDELVAAAENAENWQRDDDGPADYGDLLVVAHLHDSLGTPTMQKLPRIDETPAYRRLDLGEFDPQAGLKVVRDAQAITTAIRLLLH